MVLWMKNRWKIFATNLKQSIQDRKQDMVNSMQLSISVFEPEDTQV